MYKVIGFKDGWNYCLEIQTPYEKRFKVFPTLAGCKDYLCGYIWHLDWKGISYELEVEELV